MNQHINFLENYNGKMFNDAFSTIRLKDEKFQIGNQYEIKLKFNWCGDAEIVYIKDFYLNQLNDAMSYLDTSLSVRETQKLLTEFYEQQCVDATTAVFSYIVLKRITKDKSLKAPIYELYENVNTQIPAQ